MNARDNLKPKSIRVAILQALSDGAITTIDDLQFKIDEKREKIINNIYPAAAEGLIKRMRDDVTKLAAYQILPKGRDLLAKYSSGKVEAPADVVEAEKPVITPGVKVVTLADVPDLLAQQKDEQIERLNRLFLAACADLAKINQHLGLDSDDGGAEPIIYAIDEIKASLELSRRARQTAEPVFYALQRPAKPLVRFTKLNSAETRAMAFARGGQRAQVFALTLVGTAVPGSEWRKA